MLQLRAIRCLVCWKGKGTTKLTTLLINCSPRSIYHVKRAESRAIPCVHAFASRRTIVSPRNISLIKKPECTRRLYRVTRPSAEVKTRTKGSTRAAPEKISAEYYPRTFAPAISAFISHLFTQTSHLGLSTHPPCSRIHPLIFNVLSLWVLSC